MFILTSEVIKADVVNYDEDETWTAEALDVLLETWNVIFGVSQNLFPILPYDMQIADSCKPKLYSFVIIYLCNCSVVYVFSCETCYHPVLMHWKFW